MAARTSDRLLYVISASTAGEQGPYSQEELRELVVSGRIQASDVVRSGLGKRRGTVSEVLSVHREAVRDARALRRPSRARSPSPILLVAGALAVVAAIINWWPRTLDAPVVPDGIDVIPEVSAPVVPPPPAVAPASTLPNILRDADFSQPIVWSKSGWQVKATGNGAVSLVPEGDHAVTRLTVTNGDIKLRQRVHVLAGSHLRLAYRVRVAEVTPGKHGGDCARIVARWCLQRPVQGVVDVSKAGAWMTGSVAIPPCPETGELEVWVGLSQCSGVLEVAWLRLIEGT